MMRSSLSVALALLVFAACNSTPGAGVNLEDGGASAVGNSSSNTGASSSASAAGSSSSSAQVADGGAPCFPQDPSNNNRCNAGTQLCLNNYAADPAFPHDTTCQPMVADCMSNRNCACVKAHLHCGINTLCSDTPSGLVTVVCEPD